MASLDAAEVARLRLRRQRLVGEPLDSPAEAVRWLGAVQSQDYHGAKWALAQRLRGADEAALDRAFDAGEIVRTHAMRPTWHFVAPEDLRWILALTSPRVHRANGSMYRSLELDEATRRRAHAVFEAELAGGRFRTREELADALEAAGVPEARGQRLAYLAMHAELEGLICSGPRRGKRHTYALLEERVPAASAPDRDEALAALARRYFRSHGPATAHDFAWWSGLTVADARRAVEALGPEAERCEGDGGRAYWTVGGAPTAEGGSGPTIHLLPNYDEQVVAYRDKDPGVDPEALRASFTRRGGPMDVHLVAREGRVIGGWRRTVTKRAAGVRTDLLVPLSAAEHRALRRAAERYGRFLGLPVEVWEREAEA